MEEIRRRVRQLRIYNNQKFPHNTEEIVKNSETLEDMVVYRKLYEDGTCWVRPLTDFLEEVDHKKYPKVKQKYRFELQEDESVMNKFKGE